MPKAFSTTSSNPSFFTLSDNSTSVIINNIFSNIISNLLNNFYNNNTDYIIVNDVDDDDDTDDFGYTYDRIVLGVLTTIVCIYVILQILLTFYQKHKIPSFNFGFLVLCCFWMILRSVFWFVEIENCGVYFLDYLPLCTEFAVFTLLVVFFLKLLNYGGKWEKPLFFEKVPTHGTTLNQFQANTESYYENLIRSPHLRNNSRRGTNSGYGSTMSAPSLLIHPSNSINNDDDFSKNENIYDEETTFNVQIIPKNYKLYKILRFIFIRKNIYMFLWLLSNIIFFSIVLSFCIHSCVSIEEIEKTNSVIGFVSACSFALLMILLLIIGIRMVYIFKKRNDIPISLKVSRITGPGMIIVIIVNCFVFTSRAIFDCLILIPRFPKDYLKFPFLRSTDYGKVFIIVTNFVWEIIPILSILIFFSSWKWKSSVNYNLRIPSSNNTNQDEESNSQSEPNTPSNNNYPSIIYDPNCPIVFSTKHEYAPPVRKSRSVAQTHFNQNYDGETTDSLYDDIETSSSYNSAND
ncbi:hypothetical protein ABK040_005972 [Willaertia magna]